MSTAVGSFEESLRMERRLNKCPSLDKPLKSSGPLYFHILNGNLPCSVVVRLEVTMHSAWHSVSPQ